MSTSFTLWMLCGIVNAVLLRSVSVRGYARWDDIAAVLLLFALSCYWFWRLCDSVSEWWGAR